MIAEICSGMTHESDDRRRHDEEPLDASVGEPVQLNEWQQTCQQREGEAMNGTGSGDDDSCEIPARGAHGQASRGITHVLTLSTARKPAPRLLDGWCPPSHEWFVVPDEPSWGRLGLFETTHRG